MGNRNLLCVYSKKHIYDVPELADMKQRANTRTLKEMTALLKYVVHSIHILNYRPFIMRRFHFSIEITLIIYDA